MAEVAFYHMTVRPLSASLPVILGRALSRGWRAVVRAGSDGALAAVDDMLWQGGEDSFLPHGTAAMGHARHQPVYLTTGAENPAGAGVLVLVEGARIDPAEAAGYDRTLLMFDGNDPQALHAARGDWTKVRGAGMAAVYHAQTDDGKWVEKMRAPG